MPDAMPSPKEQFMNQFEREHATTLKVLRAFPADKAEFRPHPRSQSARELANTFVVEQGVITGALTNTLDFSQGFPKPPENFESIIEKFDNDFRSLMDLMKKTPDSRFFETAKFFAGPGHMADYPIIELAWFMLCDQIHHRGQYSVYVRMAGGKVPSIYGPSADEPWS
ncbi:MAG TPA: DinB family protein [Gemmatimonadaceae bacterium]|nr:DinB family protein [Gemmatimonadaceae bacterium]